jgi:hypothetical protein
VALDPNGIWQYEETDAEATASDLLNLLAVSVSDVVGDLNVAVAGKEDDLGDTGWVTCPAAGGWTHNSPVRVRRIGAVVHIKGTVSNSSATSYTVAATFGSSTSWGGAYIDSAGNLNVYSSSTSAAFRRLGGLWMVG